MQALLFQNLKNKIPFHWKLKNELTTKLYLSVYFLLQYSHLNFFLSFKDSVEWLITICFFRLPFWVKVLPQVWQENGLIPSCILTWSSKFQVLVNSLLHSSYLQTYEILNLSKDWSQTFTFSCLNGLSSSS